MRGVSLATRPTTRLTREVGSSLGAPPGHRCASRALVGDASRCVHEPPPLEPVRAAGCTQVLALSYGHSLRTFLLIVVAVLLALTVVVSVLTLATGKANLLQGAVHLIILSAFIFLAFTP